MWLSDAKDRRLLAGFLFRLLGIAAACGAFWLAHRFGYGRTVAEIVAVILAFHYISELQDEVAQHERELRQAAERLDKLERHVEFLFDKLPRDTP